MNFYIEEQGRSGVVPGIRLFATAQSGRTHLDRRTFVEAMAKIRNFRWLLPTLSYGPDKFYGPTSTGWSSCIPTARRRASASHRRSLLRVVCWVLHRTGSLTRHERADEPWWKTAFSIRLPLSFADSNGDGLETWGGHRTS